MIRLPQLCKKKIMKTNGNSSEKKGPCGTFLSIFKNITNIVSATLTSEISHWIFPDILRYFFSTQSKCLPPNGNIFTFTLTTCTQRS